MNSAHVATHGGPSAAAAAKPEAESRQRDEEGLDVGDGLEHNCFAPVTDEGLAALLGCKLRPHPDKVAEAAALASVRSPNLKYSLCLPKEILLKGISSLQARAVHLACARHEHFLPNGQRAGFFLGDGPGVGKGRQIAALVTENLLRKRGNCRAVWFSASADLALDATRDFWDIGAYKYEPVRIHDLKRLEKVKADMKLEDVKDMDMGVLFCTYSLLNQKSMSGKQVVQALERDPKANGHMHILDIHERSAASEASRGELEFGPGSRLAQIVEWCGGEAFDGALVLDECHKAKNCTATHKERGSQSESKTSRAVIEIQRRLPNARVLYVSATGATESSNLGYMQRLGLWGPGTAFASRQSFVSLLTTRGVGTMELVAMELKQSGYFLARTLSYEGVEYESRSINIRPEMKAMYNEACDVWYQIWQTILDFLEDTKRALSDLWGGHLRFFRQLLTACKVDDIEAFAKDMLAKGHCVVIGLQSTGEARTKAMAEAAGAADNEDFAFDSFADPGGLIMSTIIEKHLQEAPNKDYLLMRAKALKLPGNPLDDLINRLGGVDKVAELTGRRKRMVYDGKTGAYHYKPRFDKVPMDQVNIAEKDAFQKGEKLVAVISDAASTGISLQADMKVANQRMRVHITAELAWSADKTVQQLGRTHRSNQRQPPKYILLHTDVAGEHRFASAVAKRLEQLGALTHGDRHAACQDALSSFNVDDQYGRKALQEMYQVFLRRRSPSAFATPAWMAEILQNVPPENLEKRRQELFDLFIPAAMDELKRVDVINQQAKHGREADFKLGTDQEIAAKGSNAGFSKLMNRLLGVHVDMQRKIFDYFTALQEYHVAEAKRSDKYEPPGIITPGGIIKYRKHEVLFTKGELAGRNFHYHFVVDRGMPYEEALRRYKEEVAADPDTSSGFFTNTNAANDTKQYVLALECNAQGRKVARGRKKRGRRTALYFRLIRPASGLHAHDMQAQEFNRKYRRVSESRQESQWMEKHWQQEYDKDSRKLRFVDLHLITGAIMPVLPTILKAIDVKIGGHKVHLTVMRVKTVNEEEYTGVYLPYQIADDVLRALRYAEPELADVRVAGGMEDVNQHTIKVRNGQAQLAGPMVFGDVTHDLVNAANMAGLEDDMRQTTLAVKNGKALLEPHSADDCEGVDADNEFSDLEDDDEHGIKSSKTRKKGTRRRRYGPRKARDFRAMDNFQPTQEDEDQLAQSNFWERIELPPIKEKVEMPVLKKKKTPARPKKETFLRNDDSASSTAPSEGEDPEVGSDGPIATRNARRMRKAAPRKCMADEATDDEEGREAADPDAEAGAAANSTAKKAGKDGAGAISEELLKLRLEAEPEEGQKEAEGAHDQPGKDNVPVKEGGPVAAAEGDGADSDASSDSAPEMRYASDESDSEDDVSPATKRKARRARKAQAGSDEGEDASPVARPKSHRRGAAAKMAEEAYPDDSNKEETEPSDVDMSGSDSEDEKPIKVALRKKCREAASAAKKQATEMKQEFSTNSAITEGWVVKCVCGVKKDDGRPMIECEDCKAWQHTKCVLGKAASKKSLPNTFVCRDCWQKSVEQRAAAAEGNADRHVEEDVAVEHEKDPVGAEVAGADMAAAGEDDDGVTPQKRKTPLDDVASSAKRQRSRSLLERSGQRGNAASGHGEAAANANDAMCDGLEDSEASGGNACINLLDDSEDEDTSRPQRGLAGYMEAMGYEKDWGDYKANERPLSSPGYSPTSPVKTAASPVYAPSSPGYAITSPGYSPISPVCAPSCPQNAAASPVHAPTGPRYSPTSPVCAPKCPQNAAASPVHAPTSPHYSPTSPVGAPSCPQNAAASPVHAPTSPRYSPTSPVYAPSCPQYAAASPVHAPTSPRYSPTSPVYAPSSPAYCPRSSDGHPGKGSRLRPGADNRTCDGEKAPCAAPQTVQECLQMLEGKPGPLQQTPAMDAPAKKLRTFSRKTPASAPEKRRALGTADENTSVPGKSSDWPAMDPATEIKQLRQLCFLLRAELAAQSSTEGTPGPATPAFGEDTELRIEAVVKERVGAELVDVMFKARQHGRQQAEQSFKPQLDEVRREAAAALMQASLAQRALSKAKEDWQAERSALSKELADDYQASPQTSDWDSDGKELLQASRRMAMRVIVAEHQVLMARQTQAAWAAEKAELEQKAQELRELLEWRRDREWGRRLALPAPEAVSAPPASEDADEQIESLQDPAPEAGAGDMAHDAEEGSAPSMELQIALAEQRAELAASHEQAVAAAVARALQDAEAKAAAEREAEMSAAVAEVVDKGRAKQAELAAELAEAQADQKDAISAAVSEALQAAESREAAEREALLHKAVAAEVAKQAELAAELAEERAAKEAAISAAVAQARQAAESKAAAEHNAELSKAVAAEVAKQAELAAELAQERAAKESAICAAVFETRQAAERKAAAERDGQQAQAVAEAVAAEKQKQDELAADLAAVKAELACARVAESLVDAPTPMPAIKTGMLACTPASASAPAAIRSALKTSCSASKRVSWGPSVAGSLPQGDVETPFSKTLATVGSLEGPETPNSVESMASVEVSLTPSKVLEWMEGQGCAVTILDVAKGLSLPSSMGRQLRSLFADMHAEAEIYETGIGTGLYQVL